MLVVDRWLCVALRSLDVVDAWLRILSSPPCIGQLAHHPKAWIFLKAWIHLPGSLCGLSFWRAISFFRQCWQGTSAKHPSFQGFLFFGEKATKTKRAAVSFWFPLKPPKGSEPQAQKKHTHPRGSKYRLRMAFGGRITRERSQAPLVPVHLFQKPEPGHPRVGSSGAFLFLCAWFKEEEHQTVGSPEKIMVNKLR